MNIARALIEIGVIFLVMLLSLAGACLVLVWLLWGVFGPDDDM